jgi:glucokinase
MILAGDVGGTKTRLALYEQVGTQLERKAIKEFPSRDYPHVEDIAKKFFSEHPAKVTAACLGVPGPVSHGIVKITNLPWQLSEKELSSSLGIPKVRLVNDLVATAAAIPSFKPENVFTLHKGSEDREKKVFAVVAPGTGLGHALLYIEDGQHHVLASEGGHANLAPTNELEIELLKYLTPKFPPVSVERVLCGPGLVNIYSFLKDTGVAKEPPELTARLAQGDQAATISKAGLSGEFEICAKTLDLFASMLGTHAGNIMLTFMATGGIYLGGGIPPKICDKLAEGKVAQSFLNKGKLSHVVQSTPLHVIKDDFAAVVGAASLASRL